VAAVPSVGRATSVERPAVPGAAAAGDLYERYSGQIFGYCYHQLGSREEAEDAVQTTFMNAFRGLQRGIVPELESAWLFKIAHNVCLSRRRSSWRRGKVEAPNNFEVLQEVVPGRDHVVADELIRLQDVLEEMPENQRRAILLREWQGLTYREISDELGLSQAAVETLIFRARRALAQGLEQDADTWKRRLRRGADVGGAIACVKTLLGGGGAAAIKVGTTAALVATAAVTAATAPVVSKHSSTQHVRPAKSAKPAIAAPRLRTFASTRATTRAVRITPIAAKAASPSSRPHASALARTRPPAAPPMVSEPEESTPAAPPAAPPAAAETEAAPAPPPSAPESEPQASTPPPPPASEIAPHPAPPAPDPPADQSGPPPESQANKPDKPANPDGGHGKDHK
jgi:RNA polymerase sigma factor (sigma-70 family)